MKSLFKSKEPSLETLCNQIEKTIKTTLVLMLILMVIVLIYACKIVGNPVMYQQFMETLKIKLMIDYQQLNFIEKFILIYYGQNGVVLSKLALSLLSFIASMFALNQVARLFKAIRETNLPFALAHIPYIKKALISIIVAMLLGSQGYLLIYISAIVFVALIKIYEYGCKLQIEADDVV